MTNDNLLDRIRDQIARGLLSADRANIELVSAERVRLVTNSIPRAVRKQLNLAVKAGELGHMKKDGHKPEAFFHPNFDFLARRRETKKTNR